MQTCPTCGESNPDRASFCLACGSPLARRPAAEAERKTVTVLFCDLVGFTARSDRADPEDVKATLRPFHAMLKRRLDRVGGTLDKFIGDAVLGVFGAPVSHEDDPERAIRGALGILDGIAELNEAHPGLDLAVRIGVATGEAFVSFGPGPQVGDRVTGEVMTLAGALQAAAPAGGIAVGEQTYRATKDLFVFEPLEPIEVPGREAVPIWRVVSGRSRLVRETLRTPFVGRSEESSMLRAAFRRAAGEPSVQLVTMIGEPGVGKTRVIAEFASYLDEQPDIIRWRQGRSLPYGEGVGFWPLSEIVKAEAGILESDPPAEARAKLGASVEALVDDPSERDWMKARLAPLAGLGEITEAIDRQESFTAWRRYLEAMAAQHTTVLVFEDLHWGDRFMLEFVEHLVDWSTALPLLVVCAARPELYERFPGWGGGKRNSATISLPPLSEAETAMLISGLLDQAILPAETQSALLERAGGNPLFAEEFVRMLTDQGLFGDRTKALHIEAEEIAVPETVQALIGARLDTLPAESKALLHDAAVFGKVFWSGALAAMSGMAEEEVRIRLHDIAKKELVRPARTSSVKDQAEYAFWHILIRDVAYAQIPHSERGGKHRAAAAWLEGVVGDRVADQAEALAHHYGQALELARSGGETDEVRELQWFTARYLMLAGDRALRVDLGSAEAYYRRAVELLPPGHPDRPRALVKKADAAASAGRFLESEREFGEAVTALRGAGDPLALGEALALQARSLSKIGHFARATRLLEESISILEPEPPGPELARAYSRMAGLDLSLNRLHESLAWAEKALALAERLGLEDEIVRARQNKGAARCELGDMAGLADLWSALRLGLELGLGEETTVTYGNLAVSLWIHDGPGIASQVWSAAVEYSELRGFLTEAMWSKAGQLEVLYDLGKWDELLAIAAEMDEFDRSGGGGQIGTFAEFYAAMVQIRRGEVARAVANEEDFLPRVRTAERAEFLAPALTAGATIEQVRGHRRTAVGLVEEFREATRESPNYRLHYLPDALRVLEACGELADTAGLARAEALLPDEAEATAVRLQHCLVSARAILAEARGDLEDAAELYADAAGRWLRYGSVVERGQALLGQGRCLLALRDPGAAERLREAREIFASLGAKLLLAGVDDLLGEETALTS
ncbi:MAG TPA: adenylate/guanylate cyclase domain-containing protein [Actinomycetota bacterium]